MKYNPDFHIAALLICIFLLSAGCSPQKPRQAIPEVSPAVSPVKSSGASQWKERLNSLIYRDKLKEAGEVVNVILKDSSEDSSALVSRGIIYLYQGEYDQAVEDLKNAFKTGGESDEAKALIALAYVKNKRTDEAEKVLSEIRGRNDEGYICLYVRALIAGSKKDEEEEMELLNRAVEKFPPEIKTASDLERNSSEHPFIIEILQLRGELLMKHEQLEKSAEVFTKIIRLKPHHFYAYEIRGHLYEETGHYKEGVEDLTFYLKNPHKKDDLDWIYMCRGRCWKELDNMEQARANFNKALEINPRNVSALVNLGFDYREHGKHKKAREYFQRVLDISRSPTEDVMNDDIAQAHYVLGEYDQALKYFEKAVKKTPDYYVLYYFMGDCYYHKGDYTLAEKYVKKALSMMDDLKDSEVREAHRLLKKIKEKLKKSGKN